MIINIIFFFLFLNRNIILLLLLLFFFFFFFFFIKKKIDSINIMVEIASLMSNPEYTEKAELNELLNWYFEKIKEIKITKTESKSKNLNQT